MDVRNIRDRAVLTSTLSATVLLKEILMAADSTNDCINSAGEFSAGCTSWASNGFSCIGAGLSGYETIGSSSAGGAGMAVSAGPGADNGSGGGSIPRLFCSPSLLDSLFLELSSTALVQGRMLKKIWNNKKQDIWR